MAEALKNMLSQKTIVAMSHHFKKHYHLFDEKGFVKDASDNFEQLELKARTQRITQTMIDYLPKEFEKAADILLKSLGTELDDDLADCGIDENGIAGWATMSLSYFVALKGKDHFKLSMRLLREMTKRASAEFDIRFFLQDQTEQTLRQLHDWLDDDNQHIRRLVSEGTRPRLPWGMSLTVFINDPSPVIALLEKLKDDEKEYVRRSVANNLNDISKDHPKLVTRIAKQWMKNASSERVKLIRHACRSLMKDGDKNVLAIFGYIRPQLKKTTISLISTDVVFGESLEFELVLNSNVKQDQPLMIDYIIHHRKANGTTSPKVFKLRSTILKAEQEMTVSKRHAIKKITTRKYYAGKHQLEVVVNGDSIGKKDFELIMP